MDSRICTGSVLSNPPCTDIGFKKSSGDVSTFIVHSGLRYWGYTPIADESKIVARPYPLLALKGKTTALVVTSEWSQTIVGTALGPR